MVSRHAAQLMRDACRRAHLWSASGGFMASSGAATTSLCGSKQSHWCLNQGLCWRPPAW
jgi:hypothetical protein